MRFFELTFIFIVPILSIIGFITNLLSTIVFSLIIKNGQKDDMYKHLLLKSICEMLGCFFSVFNAMYCLNCTLRFTYIMVIWFIWFEEYIIQALFIASTGFEIAATFNCAISIEKRMKWCERRLSFWLWVIFIFIISFGIEMFPVFMFDIENIEYIDEYNRTVHKYDFSSNYLFSKFDKFGLVDSIIKDVILLLILLTLNIYILFNLIQIGRRKKRLNTKSSNVKNSNRAENRKIIMIIVLFLKFLLAHLPSFLNFTFSNDIFASKFWLDIQDYGTVFLYFSYSTSFFVYLAFNNIFRSFLIKITHLKSFN
jgi:hypothetical protein